MKHIIFTETVKHRRRKLLLLCNETLYVACQDIDATMKINMELLQHRSNVSFKVAHSIQLCVKTGHI